MIQPFKHKYIKNYLFSYLAVTAVVILFFILNHFYNPVAMKEAKVFEVNNTTFQANKSINTAPKKQSNTNDKAGFKLLDKAY